MTDIRSETEDREDLLIKIPLASRRPASTSPHRFNTIPYKQATAREAA